jgi:CcmD family protein
MWRWKTRPGRGLRVALGAAAALMLSVMAHGQTPAQDYGPPTEIARDSLPALPLLYTAYAFAWVALIGYVFMLWRRLAKVERELADVRGRIARNR